MIVCLPISIYLAAKAYQKIKEKLDEEEQDSRE